MFGSFAEDGSLGCTRDLASTSLDLRWEALSDGKVTRPQISDRRFWRREAGHTHRAHRPSPADEGVDQIRNKKLQIHACAHKRVYVFTVINQCLRKGPFSEAVSVRLSID